MVRSSVDPSVTPASESVASGRAVPAGAPAPSAIRIPEMDSTSAPLNRRRTRSAVILAPNLVRTSSRMCSYVHVGGTSTCMSSSSLNRTFSFHVTVPSSSASLNRFRFSMSTCPSLVRPLSAARTRWYQSSRSSSGSPTCSLSTVAPTCCAVAPRKDPSSPARSSASSRGSPPPPPPTPTPVPKSIGTATPRASSSRLWSAADTIRR
mmetsp:Transcript_6098/g.27376  ORF Transcript_6098/g.27376 Transcript_6098/m.27376 type:complete len:207 (+) Transcript_6098:641-1261(+)